MSSKVRSQKAAFGLMLSKERESEVGNLRVLSVPSGAIADAKV